jgi:PKD repeat protein
LAAGFSEHVKGSGLSKILGDKRLKYWNFLIFLLLIATRETFAQDISINPNQPGGIGYCHQAILISPNFTMDASFAVTGMKVSVSQGYHAGEDELRLPDNTGAVLGSWSTQQGFMTLTGSSNINDYIQAIRQIQYVNNSNVPTNGIRTLTFSLNDADYLPDTKHFYRFIGSSGIYWTTAKAQAESAAMKYHGLQGYLATITSAVENAFIQQKTQGVGWIGASDAAVEGEWRWVTGPEGLMDSGKGLLFWRGSGYQAKTDPVNYGPVNGAYHNWNRWDVPYSSSLASTNWEPNNSGDEDYAHITYFPNNPSESLKWNDLPNGGTSGDYTPAGYLIEFGGMPGDPVVNLTADISLQVNTVSFNTNRVFTQCEGDPVQLNKQDNYSSVTWLPVAGLSNPGISNPVAKPAVTTLYTVTAINGACKDSAKFTVNINPAPVSSLQEEVNICAGSFVKLDPGVHTSYLWNGSITSQTINVSTEGKYVVKIKGDNGCQTTDSAMVYVRPYPRMGLSGLTKLICGSTAVTLNITKDKGEWLITNLFTNQQFNSPAIQVANYGVFPFGLKLTDAYGCSVDTFLTMGFHENPVVELGKDTTVCNPSSIILDAGATSSAYQWSTGETVRKIEVNKPGTYNVLAKNVYGCAVQDSIKVGFTDKPKINLGNLDSLICGSLATTLNISADKGKYQLSSKDPVVIINGLSAKVPVYGYYPMTYVATDEYGCTSIAPINMGFHKIPKVSFSIDESECYGYNLQATFTGEAAIPNARFTWVFGGDTISSKVGQNIESIPLGVGQTKRDLTLSVKEDGCSDSYSIKDIKVIPNLSMAVMKPVQCLPAAFEFVGTNTETGVTYLWNLGDGTISDNQNVTHSYTKDGYYNVKLTVTTDKGCTNTGIIDSMVYVAPIPTAGFSLSPGICLNAGKDTLNYFGTAGIQDTVHWNLKGLDPVEIIQSPGISSGPLVFDLLNKPKTNVSLYVVSRYGCQSQPASVEVKRKPVFSFVSSIRDGCAPLLVNFRGHSGDPVDQLNYYWDFGDGNKGTGTDLNNTYQIPDLLHDVRLKAVSEVTGCADSLFAADYILVHPDPTVDFSVKDNLCQGLGAHSVLYTGSGDDKDHYHWDLSAFVPNELIKNPGDTKGPLTYELIEKPKAEIKLQVVSKFGCLSENKALVLQRIPMFNLQAEDSSGCIPFEVNLSAVTSDKVDQVDYGWLFGDGSSGSGTNVSHTYPLPDKTYDISLYASSKTTGCRDTLLKPALIVVFPEPTAAFEVNKKILYNEDPVPLFTNHSVGAERFLWNFDDGQYSHLKDPSHKYDVVGPRRVLLESVNQFGCADTISDIVMIALNKIFTPNAFSPNATNAVDREFFPYCNGVVEKNYHLRILSRWNDVVFECKNELKGWDGRMSNGSYAPAGNYIWILSFEDFLGKNHHQNGTVTLIF